MWVIFLIFWVINFVNLLFSEILESGDRILSYLRITLYLEFESFDFFSKNY